MDGWRDGQTDIPTTRTTDGEWSQYLTLSLRLRWAKKLIEISLQTVQIKVVKSADRWQTTDGRWHIDRQQSDNYPISSLELHLFPTLNLYTGKEKNDHDQHADCADITGQKCWWMTDRRRTDYYPISCSGAFSSGELKYEEQFADFIYNWSKVLGTGNGRTDGWWTAADSLDFVCVEVLRPSQPNRVMSSVVSLPNHTFTGQA